MLEAGSPLELQAIIAGYLTIEIICAAVSILLTCGPVTLHGIGWSLRNGHCRMSRIPCPFFKKARHDFGASEVVTSL